MGSEYTLVNPYALGFYRGRARRISHERAQAYTAMARSHAEASDGTENCRERAERFDIIAVYRADCLS